MKNVHYLNPMPDFIRILRPIDLASLGIHTKETLVWSPDNNFCVTLNNKVSDSLVDKLPTEFRAIDVDGDEPDDEIDDPLTSLQSPQGSVNDLEGNENDDDDSSTLDDEEES